LISFANRPQLTKYVKESSITSTNGSGGSHFKWNNLDVSIPSIELNLLLHSFPFGSDALTSPSGPSLSLSLNNLSSTLVVAGFNFYTILQLSSISFYENKSFFYFFKSDESRHFIFTTIETISMDLTPSEQTGIEPELISLVRISNLNYSTENSDFRILFSNSLPEVPVWLNWFVDLIFVNSFYFFHFIEQ